MASSPSATRATRRRQRSTRLSVAVALLVLSALLVSGAAVTGSWLLVTTAAGLAVLLGAAATRITHSELAESRREAAADRAAQAQAYRDLTVARTEEHASYVFSVQATIARHETTIDELEGALTSAQKRAADTTRKLNAEARRADLLERENGRHAAALDAAEERAAEAIVMVAELEQELDVVRAELDVVTAAWHTAETARKHA